MLTGWWDLTDVGRFSNAEPVLNPVLIMRINLHLFFKMWEPEWKPTSGSHTTENRFKNYFFGEPDRFSHRTQIRFSEFSVSFNWVPPVLLLTWDCYSSLVAITFLPFLFFSLYYYYSSFYCYYCSLFIGITLLFITVYFFPIALILSPFAFTFLTWCLSFRAMKSFKY
jgi:hypothetical protein